MSKSVSDTTVRRGTPSSPDNGKTISQLIIDRRILSNEIFINIF